MNIGTSRCIAVDMGKYTKYVTGDILRCTWDYGGPLGGQVVILLKRKRLNFWGTKRSFWNWDVWNLTKQCKQEREDLDLEVNWRKIASGRKNAKKVT